MADPEAQPGAEPEAQQGAEPVAQRKWVALLSTPDIVDDAHDMLLELYDPPRPSRLLLRNRCARNPRRRRDTDEPASPYILAAASDRSSRLLVQYGEGGIIYLLDPNARTVTRLPSVPSSLREKSLDINPHLSIGIIPHPQSPAHYVVAQLHPGRHLRQSRHRLLYYSTFKRRWYGRQLREPQGRMRDPSAEHGVVAHDGRLWWLDLRYGLYSCDPLGTEPLRFLPLPPGCEMEDEVAFNPGTTTLLKQRRCVSASEGKLRFVEIRGLSYDVRAADDVLEADAEPTVRMWTLVDPDGRDPWEKVAYEVPFAEIWDHNTYTEAGLPQRKVPHIAFVDPDDHGILYFFHGSKLFSFDMRKKQVLGFEEGYGGDGEGILHRPIVYAWMLPTSTPTLTPMERRFPSGTHVRVLVCEFDGTNGFVEPKDNGKEIMLNTWEGRMPHSAWVVDYVKHHGRTLMLLQSSAYGRYLARQKGMEPGAAIIVDYEQPKQEDIMLEMRTESDGIAGEGFLVNYKHGIWRVSSEGCRLEAILSTPTPPRPLSPLPDEYCDVLRKIVHLRANDAGDFKECYAYRDMIPFYGRSLCELRTAVLQVQLLHQPRWSRLGLSQADSEDVLCVLPGTYGRLTPLVTDLPRSVEPMVLVVLPGGSSAVDSLRYPSMDEA